MTYRASFGGSFCLLIKRLDPPSFPNKVIESSSSICMKKKKLRENSCNGLHLKELATSTSCANLVFYKSGILRKPIFCSSSMCNEAFTTILFSGFFLMPPQKIIQRTK